MPSASKLLLLAAVAYQTLAAPIDIPARDVSYDNGQYHWTATNSQDDGQWHPDPTGQAPPPATPTLPVIVTSDAPAPSSVKVSVPAVSSPVVKSSAKASPSPAKASPSPAKASPSPAKASPSPAKASPSPAKASSSPAASSPAASSPAASSPGSQDGGSGWTAKKSLSGDGSNWPKTSDWVSFDKMWSANQKDLKTQCTGKIQNSDGEISAIKAGIIAEAKTSGVDERFILAIIMQESHGCVRVGATSLGVNNPGIMQDHNGANNCAGAAVGACSDSTIAGMIHDGTSGTKDGSGLKQEIASAAKYGGKTDSQKAYIAARLYNSGDNSYKTGDDLSNPPDATASYSSDIANRLMGLAF